MSTEEQNSWLDFDKAKDWASQKVDDHRDDVSEAANWVEGRDSKRSRRGGAQREYENRRDQLHRRRDTD